LAAAGDVCARVIIYFAAVVVVNKASKSLKWDLSKDFRNGLIL
jgi:hypothetical protein